MNKSWYKSKAVWGGLLISLGAVVTATGQFLSGTLDFGTFITTVGPQIGAGLGVIGLRTAMK